MVLLALFACTRPCAVEVHGDAVDLCVVSLTAEVRGEGDLEVVFEEREGAVRPVVRSGSGGTLAGVVATGPHGIAGARLWRQGYQSWSWSGVTELEGGDLLDVGGDGDALTVAQETAHSSWWAGLVGGAEGSLLLGATSAAKTKVYTAFDADDAWVVWGLRGEAIAVEPGGEVVLDPLYAAAGDDPVSLWTAYGEAVGRQPLPERPPTGWATWYQFYSEVTEDDVRSNLAAMPAELEVFQLDDGWQVLWGEWRANERFPSGMAALAGEIALAGHRPGLWMAPFYVHRDAAAYRAHDDWWVRDASGAELSFSNVGTGDYAVLDVTHPDAAAWLAAEIRARVAEGWTYLKLDFLYAGAQEGLRHEDVTGMEAYHRGLALLREAAGEDTWILACGAPMLPSVGYAQSYRTGTDIAFEPFPDPRVGFERWQARSTAARGWQSGLWWWADPDQVLVRAPLTDAQARGSVVASALAGGAWLLGDDLPALADERLAWALDPDARRLGAARPVDPLAYASGIDASPIIEEAQRDDQVPVRWEWGDGTVALINLGTTDLVVDGPGGEELLTGEQAAPGPRALGPGEGELWRP